VAMKVGHEMAHHLGGQKCRKNRRTGRSCTLPSRLVGRCCGGSGRLNGDDHGYQKTYGPPRLQG
jgi:hypothetical protein